jgi:hypothetical protein
MTKKAVIWIIAIPLLAVVAAAFLLTAIFGPTDDGLRCARTPHKAECEIRQTRFFGLSGNSSFAIPESSIRSAQAFCSTTKVGGRGAPSCNVYLSLDSGQDYPVLSYQIRSQAEASAKRLNDYLGEKSSQSIEIKEDVLTPLLLSGVVPILFVAIVWGVRKSRFAVPPAPCAPVPPFVIHKKPNRR